MRLEQKKGLKRRTFTIVDDKLKITYKTFSDTKEWSVNIESIGSEIVIEKKSRKGLYFIGGFFVAIWLLSLVVYLTPGEESMSIGSMILSFVLFIGCASVAFFTPLKDELHITGGNSQITFFLESPSRKVVEEFANVLIERSKSIILQRYSKIDPDVPEETMMNQLYWLRNRGLISENEYEAKKKEYKTKKLMN